MNRLAYRYLLIGMYDNKHVKRMDCFPVRTHKNSSITLEIQICKIHICMIADSTA